MKNNIMNETIFGKNIILNEKSGIQIAVEKLQIKKMNRE